MKPSQDICQTHLYVCLGAKYQNGRPSTHMVSSESVYATPSMLRFRYPEKCSAVLSPTVYLAGSPSSKIILKDLTFTVSCLKVLHVMLSSFSSLFTVLGPLFRLLESQSCTFSMIVPDIIYLHFYYQSLLLLKHLYNVFSSRF